MAQFSRYIGINYSGNDTPTSHLKELQVFQSAHGGGEPQAVNAPIAGKATQRLSRCNWSRKGIACWLIEQFSREAPIVVGLTHAFSAPDSYFQRYHLKYWSGPFGTNFLEDFCKHWPTDQDQSRVEDFINSNQRIAQQHETRVCEVQAAMTVGSFDFNGKKVAAKAAHAGIPFLKFLKEHPLIENRIICWPFDGFDVPPGKSVIVEMSPEILSQNHPRSNRTSDEQNAYAISRWLQNTDSRGLLPHYFELKLGTADAKIVQREGWILGVTDTPKRKYTQSQVDEICQNYEEITDEMNRCPEKERYQIDWKRPDFAYAELSGIEFCEWRLPGISFRGAKLVGAKFRDCDLDDAFFYGADCKEAIFLSCSFQCANFRKTDCRNTSFADCGMTEGDFLSADLRGTDFTNTDISKANLQWAQFDQRSSPIKFIRIITEGVKGNRIAKQWIEEQAYLAEYLEANPEVRKRYGLIQHDALLSEGSRSKLLKLAMPQSQGSNATAQIDKEVHKLSPPKVATPFARLWRTGMPSRIWEIGQEISERQFKDILANKKLYAVLIVDEGEFNNERQCGTVYLGGRRLEPEELTPLRYRILVKALQNRNFVLGSLMDIVRSCWPATGRQRELILAKLETAQEAKELADTYNKIGYFDLFRKYSGTIYGLNPILKNVHLEIKTKRRGGIFRLHGLKASTARSHIRACLILLRDFKLTDIK